MPETNLKTIRMINKSYQLAELTPDFAGYLNTCLQISQTPEWGKLFEDVSVRNRIKEYFDFIAENKNDFIPIGNNFRPAPLRIPPPRKYISQVNPAGPVTIDSGWPPEPNQAALAVPNLFSVNVTESNNGTRMVTVEITLNKMGYNIAGIIPEPLFVPENNGIKALANDLLFRVELCAENMGGSKTETVVIGNPDYASFVPMIPGGNYNIAEDYFSHQQVFYRYRLGEPDYR